jgi:hypothetical protein
MYSFPKFQMFIPQTEYVPEVYPPIPPEYEELVELAISKIPYTPCAWEYYGNPEVGSVQEHCTDCYGFNCAIDYCCLELRDIPFFERNGKLERRDFEAYAKNHFAGNWGEFAEEIKVALEDQEISRL